MSQLEFLPVPNAEAIDRAFQAIDGRMHETGGVRVVAGGESSFSVVDDEAMRRDMALAQYATFLIDYDADKNAPDVHAPAHAFAAGYTLAGPVNDELYGSRYSFDDYYGSLHSWMTDHPTDQIQDEEQWFKANAFVLRGLGDAGLQRFGYISQDIAYSWAESLFSERSLVSACRFGVGAMIASGIIHQQTVNHELMNRDAFKVSFEAQLSTLATGDSHES